MKTKDKLLELLESQKNEWVSGETIGASLNISRAAVWKVVMNLRNEGYVIDAVRNKGYRLLEESDIISEIGVLKYLSPECRMLDIHVVPSAESTNSTLWEKEKAGVPEGTVFIAGMQTAGRGRLGRRFYSPADTGVYMSILFRPRNIKPENTVRLTTMAAVAACETFETASQKNASIKWINDVFIENKKVCGILTEGSVGMETGSLDAVVLGIGINAYEPEKGFPEDLQSVAGAVYDAKCADGRNILAAGFLNRLMRYYLSGDYESYVEKYRKRCFVLGKKISVLSDGVKKTATALDIDENCRLIVQYENGVTETLSTGEISIGL